MQRSVPPHVSAYLSLTSDANEARSNALQYARFSVHWDGGNGMNSTYTPMALEKENGLFRGGTFVRRALLLLSAVLLVSGLLLFMRRGDKPQAASPPPAFKPLVAVVAAEQRDVDIYLPGLGTVTPLNTVTVHSRVDGQIMEILFRDGDMVKEGDVLAVIDPRPFRAQLEQAEGQLLRDKALLANARLDLKRYAQLVPGDLIAKQQYDTQLALVQQYEGAVKSDQGAVDAARLQLTYSRVAAPISGKAGLRLVDAGNMARASDQNGIVVLTQMRPIAVTFTLPEDDIAEVLERMRTASPLKADVYNREQTRLLASGELIGLDNRIDPSTGTLRLKAVFPNENMELFPNQFVNVRLLTNVLENAVVLPAAAVRRGPQGALSYVLRGDDTVELRKVEISANLRGSVVVRSGIGAGERVVTDGAERLRDGAQVEVKE
jgi:multidrug efflux system membrane fusion protein